MTFGQFTGFFGQLGLSKRGYRTARLYLCSPGKADAMKQNGSKKEVASAVDMHWCVHRAGGGGEGGGGCVFGSIL